jgi:hypothetical protein
MGRRWLQIEASLTEKADALIAQIKDAALTGNPISPAKYYQLERWTMLREQVRQQIEEYNIYAEKRIYDGQMFGLNWGIKGGVEQIRAEFANLGYMGSFNILKVGAIENMAGYLGNGAPLNSLLKEAFPTAWEGMSDALVKGIAQGLSPRETAKIMAEGMSQGLNRILNISITEQLRAYRQATVMQYRESGVVVGYRRLVSKNGACMACLMSDGEFFELASDFTDHPRGRCTTVAILAGVDPRQWQTGQEWFMEQTPDAQKSIMGADYYKAWKDGAFKLSDLKSVHHNEVWGDSPAVTTLGSLLK